MTKDVERREREERAARLRLARKLAGFSGPQAVADRFGFKLNTYKAHESGRNGFSATQGDEYADAFGVSRKWLYLNIGAPEDEDEATVHVVPVLAMVSAGILTRDDVRDEALGTLHLTNLPPGDWIALRVVGHSMDRVSPPDSTILVNRQDRQLVPGGLYVIADEHGNATYKRYRPGPPPRFEPFSSDLDLEPIFPDQEPVIVGRVKRTMLDT